LKLRILVGEGFQVFPKSKYIFFRKNGTFLAIAKKKGSILLLGHIFSEDFSGISGRQDFSQERKIM
jgi:hypothetical protein